MIRINQLKCDPSLKGEQLEYTLKHKAAKLLGCDSNRISSLAIMKCSIDARKKPDVVFSYTVDIQITGKEDRILTKCNAKNSNQIQQLDNKEYRFPPSGFTPLKKRPVIIGTGPCGLFAGLMLARAGYQPILIERGAPVEERQQDVARFWETGTLLSESNVQFGEGGAGTFSDGKLNTLVKDKEGRNRKVLKLFVEFGAPDTILYDAKPHIGTDILCKVVASIRRDIEGNGGTFHFHSTVTNFEIEKEHICSVEINHKEWISTDLCILAIGHSARDTFEVLKEHKIPMEAKAFAVGLRVEHPQALINMSQYGITASDKYGAAPYKVTAKTSSGRGVYSFCMCPGGYVVNASSEANRLAVNGMSYSGRNGKNANSAIIVSVTPDDFPGKDALAGIRFQQELEAIAYRIGNGQIPMQQYEDFKYQTTGEHACNAMDSYYEGFMANHKGSSIFADVHKIMSEEMNLAFVEGMEHFERIISGFSNGHAILSGIESRTSSPVRIHRDETLQSIIRGLYPCGEGAGYAGGITSAAMDGLRVAEEIAKEYQPCYNALD